MDDGGVYNNNPAGTARDLQQMLLLFEMRVSPFNTPLPDAHESSFIVRDRPRLKLTRYVIVYAYTCIAVAE